MSKFIFISGGVCSSLGKGLTAASIAMLLEHRGLKISMLKLDPYLNVDPGTMNPFQHGEVYVTDDGAETDLDLGHYHRFTNVALSQNTNATSGQIYDTVIKRERKGHYLGNTVQVIPHITDEIKNRIQNAATEGTNVTLVEVGGTVGDIESRPFMEAIRQFCYEHTDSCINIHLAYVPYLKAAGELKTKPAQHSVQLLREIGIIPDMLICRSENPLPDEIKQKLSLFCNVPLPYVFDEPDIATSIYEVPIELHKSKLDDAICKLLDLPQVQKDLSKWESMLENLRDAQDTVCIGIVGKYLQHKDAYKSVFEALHHAAIFHKTKLRILNIESDNYDPSDFAKCDGILVPGGFGGRGWEGQLAAAKYCRENHVPYFGICLGMQVLVVDFARNVMELKEANSTEMDPQTPHPIISLLSEQENVEDLGGTMRLGAYPCSLKKASRAYQAYKKDLIHERHRHRFEFNNNYLNQAQLSGLNISGTLHNHKLCEIAEVTDHPWMVGVQFHPEFKSKPTDPHPLFKDFIHYAHTRN
ncbi:MAG: CTP synthase [Chlamydiia bacterium]|nr:CTP synthase [Chlamydiia bacterium]